MKLVAIMSIEEQTDQIRKLLAASGVQIFSELEMKGFKITSNAAGEQANWFSHDDHAVYSHLFFTLLEAGKAAELIDQVAQVSGVSNPVHAFQMTVEKFI